MPGQHRGRGDDAVQTQLAGQGRQDRSVRPSGARFVALTTQHRDFMAQDQDLDVLGRGAAGEQLQPAEHRASDQMRQSKQHSP